ncbi:MAG: FAD-binding protein [Gaiellaceae bacterium]|jgi:succinate dehydrogenase/fumarate reductase flavoprotein subunit
MAGLATAARTRELGREPVVHEKGTRIGGSMLLSSCVVWRHREWEDFRAECPDGDERLQRLVWERLDDAIAWLESIGAPVVWQETGNPRTIGKRFDPRGLTDALSRVAGTIELRSNSLLQTAPEQVPVVLCTGGFQGDATLVAEHIAPAAPLRLRANPWSAGDGLRHATGRGAALSSGLHEFYGRNMPDVDFEENDFVRAAQLYGRFARVVNDVGEQFFEGEISWSENDLVQATARQPHARAWYVLDDAALEQRVRDRTVADMVAAAPTAVDPGELPFRPPPGARVAVRVSPGITHTIGGIQVDAEAHVQRPDGTAIDGLFAAGADAGGIAAAGYASGLAAALVLGLAAAETIAG